MKEESKKSIKNSYLQSKYSQFLLIMELVENGRAELLEIQHAYFVARIEKNEKRIEEEYLKICTSSKYSQIPTNNGITLERKGTAS